MDGLGLRKKPISFWVVVVVDVLCLILFGGGFVFVRNVRIGGGAGLCSVRFACKGVGKEADRPFCIADRLFRYRNQYEYCALA